jgi:hypothetical protein
VAHSTTTHQLTPHGLSCGHTCDTEINTALLARHDERISALEARMNEILDAQALHRYEMEQALQRVKTEYEHFRAATRRRIAEMEALVGQLLQRLPKRVRQGLALDGEAS